MPFQVSSTAYGSPPTTMQDMRTWLSSLGVFKHTASVAKKAVHGELSLVNAMQRRLREFLLFPMGSSTKWLGHLSCLLPVDRAGKAF